jgi:hypothetical protein
VDPSAGLDVVEKRKFLTLPGLELRPLGRPGRSQSLYRLCYPGITNTVSYLYCDGFAKSIARQQLSKHVPTYVANNTEEVFSMWSVLGLFARQLSGNTPLQQ